MTNNRLSQTGSDWFKPDVREMATSALQLLPNAKIHLHYYSLEEEKRVLGVYDNQNVWKTPWWTGPQGY